MQILVQLLTNVFHLILSLLRGLKTGSRLLFIYLFAFIFKADKFIEHA